MPARAATFCLKPGCTELAAAGGYCAGHQRVSGKRPSAAKRGYDWAWQKKRKQFIARNPLCLDPFKRHPNQIVATEEVDHIIPKSKGGSDAWGNLQPLCKSCHSYKTRHENM